MSPETNCACPVADAKDCIELRYGYPWDDEEESDERCGCACHEKDDEED